MASSSSSLYATNQAILETSLRAINATKEIIRDYTRHEESIAQGEPSSDQQRDESIFQRQKIKEILDAARVFQEVMDRAVDSLASPSSPIGRLPAEILLEIFSFAVKQEAEYRRDQMEKWKAIRFTGVPLILAGVCSQWRAIVHQSPGLWGEIIIPTYNAFPTAEKELVAHRVARWKAQGAQHKQTLFIENWNNSEMAHLISHTGSHVSPWMSIDIAITYASAARRWDAFSVHATKVKLYRRRRESSLSFFLPLLKKASELTIMGTPPVWGNAPWTSLISLKLRPLAAGDGEHSGPFPFGALELRQLLNAAPRLKELELDFTRAHQSARFLRNEPLPKMVEHQTIHSLSVHLHHFSGNMGLFGLQTSLPSLHSLTILSLGLGSSVMGETGEVFSRKWDQLRSLSLYDLQIAGLARTLTLFVHLPKVHTLELTGLHVNALVSLMNILHRQVRPPSQELPLPQLARVVIRSTDIKGGTLIDMVHTRVADMRGPAIIRRITDVEIYDSPGVTVEEWKCIQSLLERGRSLIQIGL